MSVKKPTFHPAILAILFIVFLCSGTCLALEIATNFVPSMLLRLPRTYPDQGATLTFWGRTYCKEDVGCYNVDAVEPKVLIPVLTALVATGIEFILIIVLCVLKHFAHSVRADTSIKPAQDCVSSSSTTNSFVDDIDSVVKEIKQLDESVETEPPLPEPSPTKLFFVLWVLVLLLVATQVVALSLGISFYHMERTKYSDCWRAYGVGFFFECVSLGLSAISFLLLLQYIILAKIDAVHCVTF